MNVVRLYGGLGNQFFQYAFGKALEKNGSHVIYDVSFFNRPQDPPRPFGLDKFNTTFKLHPFLPTNNTIHETAELFYKKDLSLLKKDDCNFYGYWQNIAYFKELLSILKEEFKVKEEFYTQRFVELREQIICGESCSLHVRRTDYVNINGHHLLPVEYYNEALKHMHGDVYVFSDDIQWCKQNFNNCTFIEEEDYLAFELMRLCKHKIIANSTYSWWTAILDGRLDQVVVAPVKWRENEEEQKRIETEGFVPIDWIRI